MERKRAGGNEDRDTLTLVVFSSAGSASMCVVCVCKLDAGRYLSSCVCVDGSLNELFRSCLMARWHKANELE